jgi:hypothetical protein
MRKSALFGIVLSVLFFVACNAAPPEAKGEEPAGADKPSFSIAVDSPAVKAGAKGAVKIKITPAKGFKWNENYPSSFTVSGDAGETATVSRTEFDRDAFAVDKAKAASVEIPFEGKKTGETTVGGVANFSVCNDETCLIFRDEKVEMKLAVR